VVGMTVAQKLLEAMILEAVFNGDMELAEELRDLAHANLNTRQVASYLVQRIQHGKVNTKKNKVYEVEDTKLRYIS
jgi:hypothetical protein